MSDLSKGVYRAHGARYTIVTQVGRKWIHHVPMREGALVVRKQPITAFMQEYRATDYPLERAVERFIYQHSGGCSDAAARELMEAL